METYFACGSIAETARRWHTSRNLVRKWVRRFKEEGLSGLRDRSRRPHSSPTRTPSDIEAKVREARERTGYGRKRLSWYLWQEEDLVLSPHTIRHIPAAQWIHRPEKKAESVLSRPLGLGRGTAVCLGPGGREGHPG